MADFILPSVGEDFDTWGTTLNNTMQNLRDEQDAVTVQVAGLSSLASGAANDAEDALTQAAAAAAAAIGAEDIAAGLLKAAVPLRGEGVDPTGVADSTAAVQAILDASVGGAVQVVAGDVLRITGQILVPAETTLIGPGEIRVTAGIEHTSAIRLATGSRLVDVKLTNPNQIISGNTGGRSYGVSILGNDVLVQGCTVDGFENGIAVLSGGEWHNTRIIGNRVKDVIGWNSVPSNNGTTGGEDRGDGIVTWGALAVVVGNVVNAKAGFDARIGIHAESLKTTEDVASPHDDRMTVVSGNVVYGKFRRGITIEETKQATVVGNTVADSTWWGISVILGEGHVVANNTIRWTRTSSDTQGSNYSPSRGPIAILKQSDATIVQGNTLVHADGSSASGSIILYAEGVADRPVDCFIHGNTAICVGTGTVQDGLRTEGLFFIRPVIKDNLFSGWTRYGINLYTVTDPIVEGNTLRGVSGTAAIVKQNGGGRFISLSRNNLFGAATGLSISSATGGTIAQNYIDCATAFFATSATGMKVLDNKFGPLCTTMAFPDANANYLDGNMELQGTATVDPASMATGARTTFTITVTGASVGNSNFVMVAAPYTLAGVMVTAYVSAADTVTVVLKNDTGGTVDLASGVWKARILGR